MSNHFAYLLEDDSREFFQKIAGERAVSEVHRAKPRVALQIEKTAAVEQLSAFEKIASHIDRDIEMIKTAGLRGEGMGAIGRASNYLSGLENNPNFSPDEYCSIFLKVAFEAFDADLEQIRSNMRLTVAPAYHDELDVGLGKIASEFMDEVLDASNMEKAAGPADFIFKRLVGGGGAKAVAGAGAGVAEGGAVKGLWNKVRGMGGRAATKAKNLEYNLGAKATTADHAIANKARAASKGIADRGGVRNLARRGIDNVKSAPAGIKAWSTQRSKANVAAKLQKEKAYNSGAMERMNESIANRSAGGTAMAQADMRRSAGKIKNLKGKNKEISEKLQTQTTLSQTPKRSGKSTSEIKRNVAKQQGEAKSEAATALEKAQESAKKSSNATDDIALGAAGGSPKKVRSAQPGDETVIGPTGRRPLGADDNKKRVLMPRHQSNDPLGLKSGSGGAGAPGPSGKGPSGKQKAGKTQGISPEEYRHRQENKGSAKTPKMEKNQGKGSRRPGKDDMQLGPAGGGQRVDTSSPRAARSTMHTAKKEGWWDSMSKDEQKKILMAAGAGFVASRALD